MAISATSREELREIFYKNLATKELSIREHLTDVLDDFVSRNILYLKEAVVDSVRISELVKEGKTEKLVKLADTYLFMCGFFPEYVSKKRKSSLGIGFFIDKGTDSYKHALNLLFYDDKTEIPIPYGGKNMYVNLDTLRLLSNTFPSNVNTLITLRKKLRGREVVLDHVVRKELLDVINYQAEKGFIEFDNLYNNPRERYVLRKGHLTRVK